MDRGEEMGKVRGRSYARSLGEGRGDKQNDEQESCQNQSEVAFHKRCKQRDDTVNRKLNRYNFSVRSGI